MTASIGWLFDPLHTLTASNAGLGAGISFT